MVKVPCISCRKFEMFFFIDTYIMYIYNINYIYLYYIYYTFILGADF